MEDKTSRMDLVVLLAVEAVQRDTAQRIRELLADVDLTDAVVGLHRLDEQLTALAWDLDPAAGGRAQAAAVDGAA